MRGLFWSLIRGSKGGNCTTRCPEDFLKVLIRCFQRCGETRALGTTSGDANHVITLENYTAVPAKAKHLHTSCDWAVAFSLDLSVPPKSQSSWQLVPQTFPLTIPSNLPPPLAPSSFLLDLLFSFPLVASCPFLYKSIWLPLAPTFLLSTHYRNQQNENPSSQKDQTNTSL